MARTRRGFTIIELGAGVLATTVLLAATLPSLQQARSVAQVEQSLDNLVTLGIAHVMYSATWDGRQFSNTVYDLSTYGSSQGEAFPQYKQINGEDHPPVLLGWTDETPPAQWAYWMYHPGNWGLGQPFVFQGQANQVGFGWFRIPNAQPLHDFVAGRLYEPTYYAPADTEVYELVEPLFDDPGSFDQDAGSSALYWSSYCLSAAALFHPDVIRNPADGGWQDPWTINDAFTTPGFAEATYPSLKTQFIEHNWNQNAPSPRCIPGVEGPYDGCEPYYFNHGLASQPATLFYDLAARVLPNTEALAADAQVMGQTGFGLWSRDTPFGEEGYFGALGVDVSSLSHHVLTTDGIHGRDTLAGASATATPAPKLATEGTAHAQTP